MHAVLKVFFWWLFYDSSQIDVNCKIKKNNTLKLRTLELDMQKIEKSCLKFQVKKYFTFQNRQADILTKTVWWNITFYRTTEYCRVTLIIQGSFCRPTLVHSVGLQNLDLHHTVNKISVSKAMFSQTLHKNATSFWQVQVNLADVGMCSTRDKMTRLAWQATEGFVCLFNVSQLFYSFPPAQKPLKVL